jgi:hypothetical protein
VVGIELMDDINAECSTIGNTLERIIGVAGHKNTLCAA